MRETLYYCDAIGEAGGRPRHADGPWPLDIRGREQVTGNARRAVSFVVSVMESGSRGLDVGARVRSASSIDDGSNSQHNLGERHGIDRGSSQSTRELSK